MSGMGWVSLGLHCGTLLKHVKRSIYLLMVNMSDISILSNMNIESIQSAMNSNAGCFASPVLVKIFRNHLTWLDDSVLLGQLALVESLAMSVKISRAGWSNYIGIILLADRLAHQGVHPLLSLGVFSISGGDSWYDERHFGRCCMVEVLVEWKCKVPCVITPTQSDHEKNAICTLRKTR